MDNRWNDIATAAYGLTNLRLTESRAHFSNHFFIESSQGQFVLSCSPFQADRMVKSYQFQLMEVLKGNGFRQVSLPVQTLDGEYCYWGGKDWWVLNPYMPSDERPPWDSRDLITAAAQTLAALHSAGRRYGDELRAKSAREDLGWYYVPSTRWAKLSPKIASAFRWSELSEDDTTFLRSQLHSIQSNAPAIKSLCDEWGMLSITHQDYRPANLRIWESKIATVWDFDMAVIDYSLYDVAFASLQFGGRECLFPEVSLDLAKQFVEAYIAVTDKPEPIGEAGVLRWFLTVAVLRRLLLNYHIPERMELLRKIAGWDWRNAIMQISNLRSSYEKVGEIVFFGRMLDKIRLHHQGKLPDDYNRGFGLDGRCLRFLQIDYDALVKRVLSSGTDEEILEWCFENGRRPNNEEIQIWNQFMKKRGWRDDSTPELEKMKADRGFSDRNDILTFFDFHDADEGKS